MQRLDVLHVGRVGALHPRIDRHQLRQLDRLHQQRVGGMRKVGQRIERGFTVEGPDEAELLDRREHEERGVPRRRVADGGHDAAAVGTVTPMMKRAAQRAVDDLAGLEARAHVRAERARDVGDAVAVAPDDDAAVEEVEAAERARRDVTREADRKPRLREEPVVAFGRHLVPASRRRHDRGRVVHARDRIVQHRHRPHQRDDLGRNGRDRGIDDGCAACGLVVRHGRSSWSFSRSVY